MKGHPFYNGQLFKDKKDTKKYLSNAKVIRDFEKFWTNWESYIFMLYRHKDINYIQFASFLNKP